MTLYCLRVRVHVSRHVQVLRFESAIERALTVISLSSYVDVLDQYVQGDDDSEPREPLTSEQILRRFIPRTPA